jgi:hypothetical protein
MYRLFFSPQEINVVNEQHNAGRATGMTIRQNQTISRLSETTNGTAAPYKQFDG